MYLRLRPLICFVLLVATACSSSKRLPPLENLPVDKSATTETVALYHNLKKLVGKGIMFGHQDDPAYGVGWKYEEGRSDVKDITGDYPAVMGFELGHLEIDHPHNLDSVPFDRMKSFIRQHYARGGVNTISWHLRNLLTGKTAWDPAPGTVASILPGGQKHDIYKMGLDKVAAFLSDLKGSKGEMIPVIFRPFHELNGNWFWWGKAHCTPQEFKALWHFTVHYLRNEKGLHHLLYAFNTDRFTTEEEYLERYPGDAYVDVIGFDIYQRGNTPEHNAQFIKETGYMFSAITKLAKEKDKIAALTEFGFNSVPNPAWFNEVLWPAMKDYPISFALAWRNAGHKGASGEYEFYVPYKGSKGEKDFKTFYEKERTLFLADIAGESLYGPAKGK